MFTRRRPTHLHSLGPGLTLRGRGRGFLQSCCTSTDRPRSRDRDSRPSRSVGRDPRRRQPPPGHHRYAPAAPNFDKFGVEGRKSTTGRFAAQRVTGAPGIQVGGKSRGSGSYLPLVSSVVSSRLAGWVASHYIFYYIYYI